MFRDSQNERVYRTRIGHSADELAGDIRDRFSANRTYGENIIEQYFVGSIGIVLFPLALVFYIMDNIDDLEAIRE